ncbi:AAA family ATPase [Paenibacillus sp. JX-17]|uniref:AAA family ATPase n=1 Tax=Paenibacillus lacisoli TaxID=3064525 RepID=A0ABT9CF12_9BACL|nr:AAA family ATPase [Paenibacillus sp. JX-17]MDO7907465.1 AAA family ATPase [Paenibacillus sp. JX-17]
MIIWINGAFGAGKTSAAEELQRRLPGSYLFDPENAGYYIRDNLPQEALFADFQDFPMWRSFNYEMLSYLNVKAQGPVIVPMTLVNEKYFDEIVGRLRADGVIVCHFALIAPPSVLQQRLLGRGEAEGAWPFRQIERCTQALSRDLFQNPIDTCHKTTQQVVDDIMLSLGHSFDI